MVVNTVGWSVQSAVGTFSRSMFISGVNMVSVWLRGVQDGSWRQHDLTTMTDGPAADPDTLMDPRFSWRPWPEATKRTSQHSPSRARSDTHREPADSKLYKPRLLLWLLTIGDVPTGWCSSSAVPTWDSAVQVVHIGVYMSSLQQFHKFVQRKPQHLRSAITRDEMDKLPVVLSGCMSSLHKHRQVEDTKRICSCSYCSPAVLGRFLCSETFEDARRKIEACEHAVLDDLHASVRSAWYATSSCLHCCRNHECTSNRRPHGHVADL